jgi:hypothetical protein
VESFSTPARITRGFFSIPRDGVLELKDGRLSFTTFAGQQIFDHAVGELSEAGGVWWGSYVIRARVGPKKYSLNMCQPPATQYSPMRPVAGQMAVGVFDSLSMLRQARRNRNEWVRVLKSALGR